MGQWYYERQGQRLGPCSLEQMKQLVAAGELRGDNLVWRDGMPGWVALKTVRELDVVPASAKAPPPPPGPARTAPAAPAKPSTPSPQQTAAPAEVPKPAPAAAGPRRSAAFFSILHGLLPKPILFGLYGAVGALLGLLLLGELLYFLLRPPELKPEVKLNVPSELTVYPGSKNKLAVKIGRNGFKGPVRLSVENPPKGVQIEELTLPDDVTEVELEVSAGSTAEERSSQVQLKAGARGAAEMTALFQLNVRPTPPALKATVSPAVAVYAGSHNDFMVKLARDRFEGPVRVEVLDLPKDVQIPLITIPPDKAEAQLRVTVAKTATPERHRLQVEARSLANHKIQSNDELWLNIEPPPGNLQLAVASQVTVFPGDRNKFTVRISRKEFDAPVQLEVEGLPGAVRVAPITIAKDKQEAELEVTADASAEPAVHQLRLRAKAVNLENVTASLPVQLKVTPPPPTLQMSASPKVSVYPGGKARFGVKIARQRFDSAVRIDIQDSTGYLSAPALTIPADQTEGELEISASLAALQAGLPRAGKLQALARDQDGKGVTASEGIQVEILAPPSSLELTVSPEVQAYQGGKFRFTVKAARSGFAGPIQLQPADLPEGVALGGAVGARKPIKSVSGLFIPANASEVVLEGRAALRTAPGKYTFKLTGTGPAAPDGKIPTKTVAVNLEVKALPADKRPPPIDVIFVLDVTKSMDPQIEGVRDGIGRFMEEMKNNDLEFRVGLVAFRDITVDQESLKVLTFDKDKKETFTTDPKVFSAEVGKLEAMGGGDPPESSLEGLVEASKLPFRRGALKVLLLITDDLPKTEGKKSLKMEEAIKELKEKAIDQIHLIVKEGDLPTYRKLREVAKGGFFDLQEASKGKQFASLLPVLSQEVIEAAGPEAPRALDPPTPPVPAPPASIASEKPAPPRAATPPSPPAVPTPPPPVVGVATAPQVDPPQTPVANVPSPPQVDASGLKALQSTQVIPQEYRLQLLAAIALWTAAMAGGIGLALVGGQKLYLQQVWPRWSEVGTAVAASVAAGLVGGVIGQWFFQSTTATTESTTAAAVWEIISRVLAWGLLGGLLGAGMSLVVPNLRWQNGFLGGCAGGLIGALGFALITALAGAALGRWIGAALVGFFIGMMIALVEKVFRRYWLEVKFGEREIRTFTLGPALLAVGGDEKAATVCVRDAPARALGYYVRGSRVLCEDFGSGRTSDAPPGDQRKLANALLTVRSDASAMPTGATLQLFQVRQVSLFEGMPLTSEDVPGLEPQGADGVVALVSRRPSDPKMLLLRNRSKQTWVVKDGSGERTVAPGMSVELSSRCQINFGQVKGTLDFSQGSTPGAG